MVLEDPTAWPGTSGLAPDIYRAVIRKAASIDEVSFDLSFYWVY
jgi:hypothetical protein